MAYTKKDHLMRRIQNNYDDFKCSLRGVSREKLFETAPRIAAVTEAYKFLTTVYSWDEDGEIDFFLLFSDPLTIVADEWEDYRDEMASDIDGVLWDIGDGALAEYPLEKSADNYFQYISQ